MTPNKHFQLAQPEINQPTWEALQYIVEISNSNILQLYIYIYINHVVPST